MNRESLINAMAESAHNAWMEAYRARGITSRKAAWGEEFMVPFFGLSGQGKELDRVITRLKAFDDMGFMVLPVG